jgi:hypothetical protein
VVARNNKSGLSKSRLEEAVKSIASRVTLLFFRFLLSCVSSLLELSLVQFKKQKSSFTLHEVSGMNCYGILVF